MLNLGCASLHFQISPVERFLEKANTGHSRSSSRGNSPGRSPIHYDSSMRKALVDEQIQGFKVNIKQEKKSKFSSVVLKLRGIDQVATAINGFMLLGLGTYFLKLVV